MTNKAENREIKILSQANFCKTNDLPNFVGDGYCYHCHNNIFDHPYSTVEQASTGCPHCYHTLCD